MIRTTCISDTHLRHRDLNLQGGDLLIHAGDILNFTRNYRRSLDEFTDFLDWIEMTPYTYKVFIGGNHDLLLDAKYCTESTRVAKLLRDRCQGQKGVYYIHERTIELEINDIPLRIYGNSATGFRGMAFDTIDQNTYAGLDTSATDIVVTHTPPLGYLDRGLGNQILRDVVYNAESLVKLHVFGHIHEAHGVLRKNNSSDMVERSDMVAVNAAIGDLEYAPVNIRLE